MSLQDVIIETPTRPPGKESCCRLIEGLSLQELNALFYRDPVFQKWSLGHVLDDNCTRCAIKIQECHPVLAEQGFRERVTGYLLSGQERFAAFQQSAV